MTDIVKNKYDFVILFDVENGNPNGDPDMDNTPRCDLETNIGYVTDVCLKYKIRNYIRTKYAGKEGYNCFIQDDKALNDKLEDAYFKVNGKIDKKDKNSKQNIENARLFMCENYFDVRAFGAVMTTGKNSCGKVCGPVQFDFAQSIDPISIQEISIIRSALTTKEDFEHKDNTIGKKNFIPYGLYRAEGFISACLAEKTGFSDEDLKILFEALVNMFEFDRSAARGKMSLHKLYVFKHNSKYGDEASFRLFDRIKINKKDEIAPRKFKDYEININLQDLNNVQFFEIERTSDIDKIFNN